MSQLISPTVNLFLYDLRQSWDPGSCLRENRRQFWRKVDPDIDFLLNQFKALESQFETISWGQIREILLSDHPPSLEKLIQELSPEEVKHFRKLQEISEGIERRLQELRVLEKETSEIDFSQGYTLYGKDLAEDKSGSYLEGYYLARQLADTYVLQVSSSGQFPDNKAIQPVEQLRVIRNIIIEKINHFPAISGEIYPKIVEAKQGKLGQTWVVWGQLTEKQKAAEIVEQCYEHLTPNFRWKPQVKQTGKLLGGTVFEFSHCSKNLTASWEKFYQENYHLVLILFPPGETVTYLKTQVTRQIYPELIRLFYCRHKLLFSYWKSYHFQGFLQEKYSQSYQLIESSHLLLNSAKVSSSKLEKFLVNLLLLKLEYSGYFHQLEAEEHTLRLQVKNYDQCVEKLVNQVEDNALLFLEFSQVFKNSYLPEIQGSLKNLQSRLILLEDLEKSWQSLMEVQKLQQTERLTVTVGGVGAGLIVGGMTATLASTQVPAPPQNQSLSLIVASGLSISLGLMAILGILAWRLLRGKA